MKSLYVYATFTVARQAQNLHSGGSVSEFSCTVVTIVGRDRSEISQIGLLLRTAEQNGIRLWSWPPMTDLRFGTNYGGSAQGQCRATTPQTSLNAHRSHVPFDWNAISTSTTAGGGVKGHFVYMYELCLPLPWLGGLVSLSHFSIVPSSSPSGAGVVNATTEEPPYRRILQK